MDCLIGKVIHIHKDRLGIGMGDRHRHWQHHDGGLTGIARNLEEV